MTQPNSGDPKSQHNSQTPARPSTPPDAPKPQSTEAPFLPLTGSKLFRPPRADAPMPAPKPSAAPAPKIRPNAPSLRSEPPIPDAQSSPTDQLADMLAAARSAPTSISAPSTMATPTPRLPAVRGTTPDPLFFRKTIIPILLTFAAVLAGWATLIRTRGDDSALPELFPHWMPIALYILAAFFLLLGLFNILTLRGAGQDSPR